MTDLLGTILTPMGMKVFTSGSGEIGDFLKRRYAADSLEEAEAAHLQDLEKLEKAKVAIIGVPNDNGGGFDRGSKKGPLALRRYWLEETGLYLEWESAGIVDIGDVYDHPLLSDDRYLQEWVLDNVRRDRWGTDGVKRKLPVSALSILEVALEQLFKVNPDCRVLMLGGDHSKSLIPVQVLTRRLPAGSLGVLQFDAHTDLLDFRDGLDGSYATWSYHANDALSRGGRLVQVGLRTSGRSKADWEKELDLRQYWAEEVKEKGAQALAEEIAEHFHSIGVKNLYISNDIDALDPEFAAATGTPEPGGLSLDDELTVIEHVAQQFNIVGSDMMEVAPMLTRHIDAEPQRTLDSATTLCKAQLAAMLKDSARS